MPINWKLDDATSASIDRVIDLAIKRKIISAEEKQNYAMDLTACHNSGCRLDFAKLLDFDGFSMAHDLYGINRHIDRRSGKLRNCFLPRCAARTKVAA